MVDVVVVYDPAEVWSLQCATQVSQVSEVSLSVLAFGVKTGASNLHFDARAGVVEKAEHKVEVDESGIVHMESFKALFFSMM